MPTASIALRALIPAAYVVGSIPFGLMIGKARGIDPRKAGSGNIGATNVGRLLGGKFFALVFTLDLLKGMLPTLAAGALLHFAKDLNALSYALWLSVGFAAILGHMYSLFLGFKGGKGVATSTGVILGVYPYYTVAGIVALLLFVLVLKITRYVSLASMMGAAGFALAYLTLGLALKWDVFGRQLPLLLFAILVVAMIVTKHRANIARLRAGTENRIGSKAESVV
jgi:acyl phosphate:glycerol-3-phosphate acyltransferase